MDAILIAVVIVSLAIAGAMAVVLTRLVRDERRRTEARIAALTEMSAERPAAATARVAAPRVERPPSPALPAGDIQLKRTTDVRASNVPSLGADLFAQPERPSPWGRRVAVIGTLAAILLVAAIVAVSRSHARTADRSGAAAAPVAQVRPLELLSLRYQQQSDRMIITGLVQNPRNGVALGRVTASAFLFGTDGTFLASGRAPLDYTTLAPGDESPFVIEVPVAAPVARYRVGFRGEDGRVIAHVDRRSSATMAERETR